MDRNSSVTDHAVLRYMQRQLGVDVEAIREDLAHYSDSPRIKQLLEFAGDARCKITFGDGLVLCFQGGRMTTCYPKQSR